MLHDSLGSWTTANIGPCLLDSCGEYLIVQTLLCTIVYFKVSSSI